MNMLVERYVGWIQNRIFWQYNPRSRRPYNVTKTGFIAHQMSGGKMTYHIKSRIYNRVQCKIWNREWRCL